MNLLNNTSSLEAVLSTVNSLPSKGTNPVLQSKTVTPSTSSQSVTPDSGYDGLSQVTVNAMPTATQATPSISVSSSGLITAKATQSAGYVASGTKSATKQLTVQAAKTVTPSTSSQTAVASGRYTTGAVTVKGDANLKAENIKSGISIFGVSGTHSGAEDLSAELAEYSSLNIELESVINSLPNVEGESDILENVTITLKCSAQSAGVCPYCCAYTRVTNSKLSGTHVNIPQKTALQTHTLSVARNSMMYVLCTSAAGADMTINIDGNIQLLATSNECQTVACFKVNGAGTINIESKNGTASGGGMN